MLLCTKKFTLINQAHLTYQICIVAPRQTRFHHTGILVAHVHSACSHVCRNKLPLYQLLSLCAWHTHILELSDFHSHLCGGEGGTHIIASSYLNRLPILSLAFPALWGITIPVPIIIVSHALEFTFTPKFVSIIASILDNIPHLVIVPLSPDYVSIVGNFWLRTVVIIAPNNEWGKKSHRNCYNYWIHCDSLTPTDTHKYHFSHVLL